MLTKVHHIAIICSDYEKSKEFYTQFLGLTIIKETYRKDRKSYKLDLALNDEYVVELFSFPDPPKRTSRPEACGLRHLAFQVKNIEEIVAHCHSHHISVEPVRIDEITGKKFTFISDPDELPIEFYQQ